MTAATAKVERIRVLERQVAELQARVARIERGTHIHASVCVCAGHKHGETTGGWYCPTHGQQL